MSTLGNVSARCGSVLALLNTGTDLIKDPHKTPTPNLFTDICFKKQVGRHMAKVN